MDVALVSCPSYDESVVKTALEQVLAPFGGLSWVQLGMRIVLKANLVAACKPEAAATTHPVILSVLSALLTARGAQVIIGDSPGGVFDALFVNRVYTVTGMTQAERHGAVLNRNFSQATAYFPEAVQAKEFTYTAYLDDCDAIIDVCKLKTHGMMGYSGAAKNLFGAVPGTMKPEYHFRYSSADDFADLIVDLNEYFRPRLCICDAVDGMEGNGPTAGTPRHIGLLLAAESPHKLDLAAASVIGLNMSDVPTLSAAFRRNLIPADASMLECSTALQPLRIPDYQLIPKRSIHFENELPGIIGKVSSFALKHLFLTYPEAVKSTCIGCGKCSGVCPADAITMRDGTPSVNRNVCIRCFCCQEFCPVGAMKVKTSFLSRLLTKK